MSEQSTHVLLIEDNPGDADLIRLRLTEAKTAVDVDCVDRLSDGLAAIRKEPPSVVLLDLNLPDSHGAETFRTVLEKAPDVPVVVLSGQDDEALAIKAVHQGVQDYLVKGDFSGHHLERAMHYAVERQALLRSLEMSRKQQLEFKNRFLSHVSHELRTPLTSIHQYASLLADGIGGELTADQREFVRTILKSVNQLHAMVRDLLEAARVESGKVHLEPRCLALGDLVHQAVAMMSASAKEKRVGLEMALDSRIPLICGDPDRVIEILINLIDNGIKFTPPEGSVMVKACMVDHDEDYVYVSITDTGRGISPEARALIFERLYQDPNTVDNNRKGLGLGLYITRELVSLHGGKIWVTSEPGHGSTFTFTLPIYSLPKLLAPVITYQEKLRDAFMLIAVALTPKADPPAADWKQTSQRCLEILRRCVYLDKDVVLPAMGITGPAEAFYVLASTDAERAPIMTKRIQEQLQRNAEFRANGTLAVSAKPVPLPADLSSRPLEGQVEAVADAVTEMVLSELGLQSFNRNLQASLENESESRATEN